MYGIQVERKSLHIAYGLPSRLQAGMHACWPGCKSPMHKKIMQKPQVYHNRGVGQYTGEGMDHYPGEGVNQYPGGGACVGNACHWDLRDLLVFNPMHMWTSTQILLPSDWPDALSRCWNEIMQEKPGSRHIHQRTRTHVHTCAHARTHARTHAHTHEEGQVPVGQVQGSGEETNSVLRAYRYTQDNKKYKKF